MPQITDETIDLVNDRIQQMDEDGIGKVWDEFAREQPALVGYVLGESRELLGEVEEFPGGTAINYRH